MPISPPTLRLIRTVLLVSGLTVVIGGARQAHGEVWGVGGVIGPNSGLSLHRATDTATAVHITGKYAEEEFYLSGDFQKHYLSPFQFHGEFPLYLYGGLGISGEHAPNAKYGERFFLRLPVGGQWHISSMHMQVFAEVVGQLGEIPETNLAAEARGGLRAFF